jgi:hypothetical protein
MLNEEALHKTIHLDEVLEQAKKSMIGKLRRVFLF